MDYPLRITTKPEKKDYVLASRALAMQMPAFVILAILTLVGMVVSTVFLIFPSLGSTTVNNIAIVVLLTGAFLILYYLLLIPIQLSRAYKNIETLKMEREFVFEEKNLLMKIGEQTTKMPWQNISKVVETSSLYLFIYEAGERHYPFLPKRNFDDGSTEETLLQFLGTKSIPVV